MNITVALVILSAVAGDYASVADIPVNREIIRQYEVTNEAGYKRAMTKCQRLAKAFVRNDENALCVAVSDPIVR